MEGREEKYTCMSDADPLPIILKITILHQVLLTQKLIANCCLLPDPHSSALQLVAFCLIRKHGVMCQIPSKSGEPDVWEGEFNPHIWVLGGGNHARST